MTITPEQISELTGDALAEAVAERMEDKPGDLKHTTRGAIWRSTKGWWSCERRSEGWKPNRVIDWNAAGMLIAEIERRGRRWQLHQDLIDPSKIVAAIEWGDLGEVCAVADDLPAAVARLFLLVIGKEGSA